MIITGCRLDESAWMVIEKGPRRRGGGMDMIELWNRGEWEGVLYGK